MEKEILKLHSKGLKKELNIFLKGKNVKDLKKVLERYLTSSKEDPMILTQAVLQGLDLTDEECMQIFISLYKHLVTTLNKMDMNPKVADDVIGVLLMEGNRLSGSGLVELAQFFMDTVKNGTLQGGKSLNVFPKILSVIEAQDSILFGDSTMKGSEFKSHVLNNLCSCKWSPQTVLHLATMFRDITLTNEELRFVVEKIVRQFDDLDMRDLPSLVYQLLLLSEKGHKRLILDGITSFFINKDTLARSRSNVMDSEDLMGDSFDTDLLHQTEGTVILHISFAALEQRVIGQEFLKHLKGWQLSCASKVLSPFNLAVALSFVGMNVLQQQILDFLKSTILRSYRDHQRHEQSYWVRENFPEQQDIEILVLETVSNSSCGWDHVVQGLVKLGYLLMDSFGPRMIFGRPESTVKGRLTPNQAACQLGSKILLKVFKGHEIVRVDVLGQIFNRIMTQVSAPASHYLSLLSEAVASVPLLLLESVSKVREVFDCLPMLPADTAQGILVALLPLLKISMSLRDSLMLLLRKSIFSRQLEERKIGVQGFLALLRSFKVIGSVPCSQPSQSSQLLSSSQVPVDVHAQYNRTGNEALCLEILGILHRCLSQQADIRLSLYEGLLDVIDRNTQLRGRIMDLLLKQVRKYYEEQAEVMPPLKLEACMSANGENVYLAEPLSHLLSCILQCVQRVRQSPDQNRNEMEDDDDETEEGSSLGLEEILDSLTSRMIQADIEDFELDKSADFSTANSVGVRNNIFAALLLGIYEVLIEYIYSTGNFGVTACERLIQLFKKYKSLSDILKNKSGGGGGKKGKSPTTNSKVPTSLLSLGCTVSMLESIFSDEVPTHREGLDHLRNNADFVSHVVAVAVQKVQHVAEKGMCEVANCSKEKVFLHCCSLGRQFLTQYMENHLTCEGRERTRRMVWACLEGLVHVFTLASVRGEDSIKQCLATIVRTDEEVDIHHHIKRFQRLVNNILSADEEQRSLKDINPLMSIIMQLTAHLQSSGSKYEQVYDWIRKLCTDQVTDDIATSKTLIGCLLQLSVQMKNLPNLFRDLLQDVHSQLGDVDREVTVEDKTHFSLMTPTTAAPHVVLLMLPFVDSDLDNTDWVIARMKANTTVSALSEDVAPGATQQEGFERLVCNRLAVLLAGLHELVQSALSPGPCLAAVFKSLTKIFITLLNLVKYYLQLYTSKTGHMSSRFEKLIKLVGTQLTPHVYTLITYAQTIEQENLDNEAEKDVKKKKTKTTDSQKGRKTSARGGKQDKVIPNLIFAIEELERYLVKLSKKSKVNLMENIKTSTSRDFRINVAVVQEALHVSSSSSSSSSSEEEEDEEAESTKNDEDAGEEEQMSDGDSTNENVDPVQSSGDSKKKKTISPPTKKRRLGKEQAKLGKQQAKLGKQKAKLGKQKAK